MHTHWYGRPEIQVEHETLSRRNTPFVRSFRVPRAVVESRRLSRVHPRRDHCVPTASSANDANPISRREKKPRAPYTDADNAHYSLYVLYGCVYYNIITDDSTRKKYKEGFRGSCSWQVVGGACVYTSYLRRVHPFLKRVFSHAPSARKRRR